MTQLASSPSSPGDSPRLPTVSVVVPVFNSAVTLPTLLERLTSVLQTASSSHEVILVDDGSQDSSWTVIERLAAENDDCRGLRLMRNYGQHNALLAGVRRCRHDVIVTMDDDLQNPPEQLPRLLDEIANGSDVVYGVPANPGHGVARRMASWVTKMVLKGVMGADVATKISAFRAFRADLRRGFADAGGPTINLDVLLTWSTSRFSAITVRFDERVEGASNYTFAQLVRHAFNMLTGFSTRPLRLASLIGFAFTLFGLAVLIDVLVSYVRNHGVVPGFAFLASIIAIFSGAQLFTIGIIGEYLARMHHRLLEKPSYVVRESTPGHVLSDSP